MEPITDEQLLEELRRRFANNKKSLEELKKLTDELTLVNKKLEESEALKSHFISNITNEIVNPFTSIIALSESIIGIKDKNWDKVQSMVTLIHTEAFNLGFQFKNIFAAAKIEAGEVNPSIVKVDILSLLTSVISDFKIEAQKKSLSIGFNTNNKQSKCDGKNKFCFNTDPEKIKLIVSNLLSNAIKFSKSQGNIEIDVELTDASLIIAVKDFGIGISPENQEIIYDRFKRVDSGINSINRGHGLGLSINKAFIDLLNGQIEVYSQLDKGSTFVVTLPNIDIETNEFAADDNEFIFNDSEVF